MAITCILFSFVVKLEPISLPLQQLWAGSHKKGEAGRVDGALVKASESLAVRQSKLKRYGHSQVLSIS